MPGEEFNKIVNCDLEPVAVVAQCLDNQWVPQELLGSMLEGGRSLRDAKVAGARLQAVRHEYLRAILNAQQVIVNRAFFLNNQAVYQDFQHGGASRDAFKELLRDAVIVPYLYRETTLVADQEFTVQSEGERAWREIVADAGTGSCLRLSWDEDENTRLTDLKLKDSFHDQLLSMARFRAESLMRDFNLDEEGARLLKARLRDVSRWAVDKESVVREEFYREFVVAEGTDPAEGTYDRSKPFAGELKQLADLKYNTSLSDAVGRYPLTPADSLDRTALQELDRALSRGTAVSADELVRMLQQQAFALVQNPLDVGLTGLDLDHVRQARGTDEWRLYKDSLLRLLREPELLSGTPEAFRDRSQDVYDRYVSLAERLGGIVGARRAGVADRWQPIIKMSIHTLGSVVSVVFGEEPCIEVVGQVADSVAATASKGVVRFAVVGRDQRRARKQLETSVDLMQVKFDRTRDEWDGLIRRMQEAGFPRRAAVHRPEEEATLNAPDENGGIG
ncbi:hypothetical protein [Streptomyces qinglanensis]|uniref:Uncharacterized protein n=1 Tax=Streptomyces qinglanensis TaxID=943816 RepID=A0A1H9QS33_9ACTN|nr:hypothetical protein [Streptomyces qinglanensis]SER63401.1 hypothetical protein SAMN05421870_10387 [Streptomyces qinglanensis]